MTVSPPYGKKEDLSEVRKVVKKPDLELASVSNSSFLNGDIEITDW
jgi:hypothetical protein